MLSSRPSRLASLTQGSAARRGRELRGVVDLDLHDVAAAVPRLELVDAGLGDHAPAVEDGDAVADALHVGEDVRREEHRGAAGERRDHVEHLAPADGVEGARRLVEHEQARRVDERLSDPEPLPHAARVAADARVDALQAGEVEQGVDALAQHAAGQAEEPPGQLEELARRHPGVEAGHVGQEADQGAHLVRGRHDVAAEHPRRPRGRSRQAGEDAQRGRLAGAVGAQEAVDRTLWDGEVDAVEGARRAVDLGEAPDLDRRRGGPAGSGFSHGAVRRRAAAGREDRRAGRRRGSHGR